MSFIKFNPKDKRKVLTLPGTRQNSSKNVLLTPSGIISLDPVIGGGVTLGTVNLIEEDGSGQFAQLFLKFFMSEGIMWKHVIFNASLDVDPSKLINELPGPVNLDDPYFKSDGSDSSGELKIAWRYQNQPSVQSSLSTNSSLSHIFDVTNFMTQDTINDTDISLWPPKDGEEISYDDLIKAIHKKIQAGGFLSSLPMPRKNVLRISLHNIGSPLFVGDIAKFFYELRSLMKHSNAVCCVSIPTHLLEEKEISACEHLSDSVLKLVSLVNSEDRSLSEYHGLLTIKKLPAVNSLAFHIPPGTDWAFKLRKRRFIIEKFHLPPELQESDQREQDDFAGTCGTSSKSKLDF
ncbi:unnamed protein product [Bemisia tabaci]|uniref:Elongator complex protein 4 n=1 Tax=Bemisia tabaci TaxID=7038 RepID=A0A9P0F4I1_BEMTA|nr:unnamed protein product [Bemisia tabaci]